MPDCCLIVTGASTKREMRSSSKSTSHWQLKRSLDWTGQANDLASSVTGTLTNRLPPLEPHFFLLNQQSDYKVLYELMCWLSGSLTCRLPNVMRSPPARRSLVSSITVDWFLAPRRWGFNFKCKSTNYPDHGNHGDPPSTRKIPMVEPGIEPWTSCLVTRSSDH